MATDQDAVDLSPVLERLSEGVIGVDADLRVTQINGAGAELLGIDRGRAVGGDLAVLAGEDLATVCRRAAADGEELTVDVRPDGQRLRATVHPGADGLSVVLAAADRDRSTDESVFERLYGIASDPELSRDERIERMLAVGRERLDTAVGLLTRIEGDTHEVVTAAGPTAPEPGTERPLAETYCRRTIEGSEPFTIASAAAAGWDGDPAYDRSGAEQYLGAPVTVDGSSYGTVCFLDPDPRERPATEREVVLLEVLTGWIRHLLEERAYERELRQQRAVTEGILDSLPDPLYVLDGDGQLTQWNERLAALTGRDDDELAGRAITELVAADDRAAVGATVGAALERTPGDEADPEVVEARLAGEDGNPYELVHAPVRDDDGAVVGVVGVGRDVSEQRRHSERLSGMLEATRSLMQARSREQVAEIAVAAAREVLGFEINVFRLYDSDAGTLEPAAATDRARAELGERPVYEVSEGLPGAVFASGEPRIVGVNETPAPVRSGLYYPVGVHGTISVCSTEPGAFDRTDRQVLALLATSAAAACTRAKRESELRDAREHTGRVLSRVNGLIQNTIEVLVEAATRAEIENGVATQLAASEPYAFACVLRPNVTDDRLAPTARAGDADLPIDGLAIDAGGEDPVARAHRDGTAQVLDLAEHPTPPWDEIAVGMETLVAIPLGYKQADYGVLVVFASDAGDLDGRERAVLEALGRAAGNAINAVERGRVLDATEIIELEFAVTDPELLLNQLSADAAGRIEAVEIDGRGDGRLRTYLRVTGRDCQDVVDRARGLKGVASAETIVGTDEGCLAELVVTDSLVGALAEYGALPRGAVAENGTTRITVELAYEAEARELFELVEKRHPGTELLGYHERERPVETRQDFTAALIDRLTDRQETALRTAYHGGFFNWPRDVDGNELAAAMDISRPTFHQHLRAAQRKAFEELFETRTE